MTNVCQVCFGIEFRHYKTVCDKCRIIYLKQKQIAQYLLQKAVEDGQIIRPTACEFCKCEPGYSDHRNPQNLIFGHHWNGHNNVLDVWWLCTRCNHALPGPIFHSGKITKEQAKQAIDDKNYKKRLVNSIIEDVIPYPENGEQP